MASVHKKGNKYGNRKIEAFGRVWDSQKELDRFLVLKNAQSEGIIGNLEIQPKFELIPAVYRDETVHLKTKDKTVKRCVQLAITYTADFKYTKDGQTIIEDCKMGQIPQRILKMQEGPEKEAAIEKAISSIRRFLPKDYVLKHKMMLALKGIEVKEIYNATAKV